MIFLNINLICFHMDCGNISHWLIIWFQYNLEKENAPVVFILSTTGDGEPPDNALQFVKRIKKKTLSTDHYKHLCYALLGKFHQAVWGSALALFAARTSKCSIYLCKPFFTIWTVSGSRNLHLFPSVCSSFRRHKLCKFLQLWENSWASSTGTWSQTILCCRICRWWCRVSSAGDLRVDLQFSPLTSPHLSYHLICVFFRLLCCHLSSSTLCSLQSGGGAGPLAWRTVESN